jgi:hypothetical protein
LVVAWLKAAAIISMQGDKLSQLTAQVESLKEVVSVLEASKADEIAQKWRAKLFEELIRNKKLQILHAQEIRGLKDNELKTAAREEELNGVLDNLQRQLAASTHDRQRSDGETAKAKLSAKREAETSARLGEILAGVPQQIANNLDVLTKLQSSLDVFKQRVFIMNSRVTTTKLLLRNLHKTQFSEFSFELDQLRKEAQKADRITTEALAAKAENERLQAENSELQRMMRQLTTDSEGKVKELAETLNGRVVALDRENQELEAHCRTMKLELEALTEDKRSAERRDSEQHTALQRLEDELSLIKQTYDQREAEALGKMQSLNEALQQETQHKTDALDLLQEYKARAEELEQALVTLQARSEESMNEETSYWQSELKLKERLVRELKRERDALLASADKKPRVVNAAAQTEVRTFTPMRTTTPSKRLESPGGRLPALEELSKELLEAPL